MLRNYRTTKTICNLPITDVSIFLIMERIRRNSSLDFVLAISSKILHEKELLMRKIEKIYFIKRFINLKELFILMKN